MPPSPAIPSRKPYRAQPKVFNFHPADPLYWHIARYCRCILLLPDASDPAPKQRPVPFDGTVVPLLTLVVPPPKRAARSCSCSCADRTCAPATV